jgi:hypothetical protein
MSQYERDVAWAEEHLPDLYARVGVGLIGNIAMARAAGQLDPDSVHVRAMHLYGEFLPEADPVESRSYSI